MTAVATVVRSRMTYRAQVQRQVPGGTDAEGYPLPPSWQQLHAALPCYPWQVARLQQVTPTHSVVLSDTRLVVPKGTDIREGDRLVGVVDRLGAAYLPDYHDVDAVVPRQTHVELLVRAVSP